MNYNHPAGNDGTATIRIVCAVVFVAFSLLWLYFFQADVLTVAQHVLSDGQTSYHRLVGAVLVTLLLLMLQAGVGALTRLTGYAHALTFFPSMLVLAFISSAGPNIDRHFSIGRWIWLLPLLLTVWGGGVWTARNLQLSEPRGGSSPFARASWVNVLTLCLMMLGVTLAANTNAVFHYRAHAEVALEHGRFDEALRVGNRSLETDSTLMMLRMYALSRQGLLGERLFEYPLVTTSRAMLPTDGCVRFMLYPADSLYRHLGAIPQRAMHPMDYLKALQHSGRATAAAADYLLCGYLIDKDLDAFARSVGRYYAINDSLPRHYREALVLYTHRRSHPSVVYHDAILDVDYRDLQQLEAKYASPDERRCKVMESYANSYWYYYEYSPPPSPSPREGSSYYSPPVGRGWGWALTYS